MSAIPPVAVLRAPELLPMPEYGPEDCIRVLTRNRYPVRVVGLGDLADGLSCREVLVVCFLSGDFPEEAAESLARFHAHGGSVLFLGQLPFKESWAPTRNFYADALHLTSYCSMGRVDGWSEAARELLGDSLPDLAPFQGKTFGCGRTTPFPPDEVQLLFDIHDPILQWQVTPGIWIQRRSRAFLGAKLAQIACMGGEPRESAAGGYPMPWTHDPGLLKRDWPGMDDLLLRLVLSLAPDSRAAALEGIPVHREDESAPVKVLLRNLGETKTRFEALRVRDDAGSVDLLLPGIEVAPGELREVTLDLPAAIPGIRRLSLIHGERVLHTFEAHTLPAAAPELPLGFGFSTYWSFHHPRVPDSFKAFCRAMKARGCQYVRVNIPWEDIEPEPGRYDWRLPDAYLDCAAELGLTLLFWMFPITRGATIGDGGVPAWTLKEPALTHDGQPGLFPSLWSPFYRKHFFGMVDAFTRRYADAERLNRFVIDFGNSDFPYGYFYYVNDTTLFDYSEHERRAFADYLVQKCALSHDEISALYQAYIEDTSKIQVPIAEKHPEAWRVYLDFRAWTIREGMEEIRRIVAQNAPGKLAPDLPGHGSGSIADLNTYHLESKAKHWEEEEQQPPELTRLHNAGKTWGGEPWQVGCRYRDLDDALFHSVRLGSDYFSIAGPDIGVYGNDIARAGFVRRWLQGAKRATARIAVIDRCEWDAFQSLAHVAARMDQAVDLLSARHRYDLSCYELLVLPPRELHAKTNTGGGGGSLLPSDPEWGEDLRVAVEKGLNVLIFPETAQLRPGFPVHTHVRQALELMDVDYGPRNLRHVSYPPEMGGGEAHGMARAVLADGEVVLRCDGNRPLLVKRTLGKGAVWLAGWDTHADSLDGQRSPNSTRSIQTHSLCRLAEYLWIFPSRVRTNQAFVYKEWIRNETGEAFLAFSHADEPVQLEVDLRLDRFAESALDLATGEEFLPAPGPEDGWSRVTLPLFPGQGRYLWFRPAKET